MHIGIAGPINVRAFRDKLVLSGSKKERIPAGLGSTNVTSLVRALLDQAHQITLFTLDKSVSEGCVLQGENLKVLIGPYRQSGRARDFFRIERSYLRDAMGREAPDLVNAHWTYEFGLAAIESGLPVLVTAHDAPLTILRQTPSPYRMMRTIMAFVLMRKVEHFSTTSDYLAKHFSQVMRFPHHIYVIPNGFPQMLFEMGRRRARIAASKDRIVFATVINGGWDRRKNGRAALEAFAKVRQALPNSRLKMFGSGWGRFEDGWKNAERLSLTAEVEFLGHIPHDELCLSLVNEVDILVHPSMEEGFGNVIVEAMALKIPVIAGRDSGAVPLVMDQGRIGVLTDVKSSDAIAREMLALGADASRRSQLAESAHQFAAEHYHINRTAMDYLAAYSRVLQSEVRIHI